jgi:hypothetical protein
LQLVVQLLFYTSLIYMGTLELPLIFSLSYLAFDENKTMGVSFGISWDAS